MEPAALRRKTVLVTGAAGGLGARLVARLVEMGWKVSGLVLPGDPLARKLEFLGCDVKVGDVRDPASLDGAFDGIDTVYHLAAVIVSHDPAVFRAVNRDGTANVVAAASRAGVRHLVYVSSASVTYPHSTPYADSKRQAEAIVLAERSIAHTIVRPTLVYDESGGLELSMFASYLERFPVVPFIGRGNALKRPVWSEDLVDGLVRIAGNEKAHGKLYNLSGGEAIAMRDFARLVLEHRGTSRRFVHLPVSLCRGLARVLAWLTQNPPLTASAIAGVVEDANLDPSDAIRDLGYHPIGVREGFQLCLPIASKSAAIDRSLRTRSM